MWPPPFHSDALLFVLLFQAALWGQKNNYYKPPLEIGLSHGIFLTTTLLYRICPVLLHMLLLPITCHYILYDWNPNGAFEHVVQEWKAVTSLLQWQISLNWLPGPDLALLPPSNRVYSTSMLWCSPILLCSLQHLIWNPNGAFEHEVQEWKAITSPSIVANSSKFLGQIWYTLVPSNRVYSTSMLWCSPILLCSLQHLIWNPNGAFEHVVQEWKAVTSLLQWQISLNWLPGRARFGTFDTFESRLLHQHVFVLPNSSMLIATSYMEPKWSLWASFFFVEYNFLHQKLYVCARWYDVMLDTRYN